MSEFYIVILVILGILAISGLFVGVTNDAVNFLNSAIGSKAATMKTILIVASVGILIGVVTSSGMMEVARNGMFNPSLFSFHEVMILYLGVMFANIILLDLYNSWGLPTSTTVSLIFCLLGSAIAVSIFKIADTEGLSMSNLGDFINTSRAMGIVSAILLSVVIAFTFGTIIMYLSRIIFTFRYATIFRRFGALWCGISVTAILYFALFKGLKHFIIGNPAVAAIEEHLYLSLFICWIICSLLLFFVQHFKVNILRITILLGTFALALAFAGNDLVNFIGVPVASFDAYQIAQAAGDSTIMMDGLNESVPANFLVLLIAGIVMIITLWTSKKAMHVTETELALSAQGDDNEQYNSSLFSRTLVRTALNINNGLETILPERLRKAVNRRFDYVDIEHSGAPYDMIRAVVNLTTSALLISMATSFKLPLSTTYVTFMVAMGSSLADKAWGRESAVYRITGVMTVIMGWFVTALGGFLIAFATGLILIYGGVTAVIVITILCGWMLYHSNFRKKITSHKQKADLTKSQSSEEIISNLSDEVCRTMECTTHIYDRTLLAVFKENRKVLRDLVKESNDLYQVSSARKYALMSTLKTLQANDIDTAQYYVQVVDYLNEMTKALIHITRPAFEHIDNNHEGLSKEQTEDLMHINDEVEDIYRQIEGMLSLGDFSDIDSVLAMRDNLFETISAAIKSELERLNVNKASTKASILYLTILNETKNMVLQSRNLLKAQRYFVENSGAIRTMIHHHQQK
ncbi:MAG: inorganic phosphate transporter [Alistipes sp.]